MGDYKQAERKARVTGLMGDDDFLVKTFRGTDTISQLFRFHLDLLAETKTRVPFDRVLGKKATVHLALADGSEHHVNGLCVRFTQGARGQEFTLYRAELVPEAWLLTRKTQSRIFQHLPIPEILRKVLAAVAVRWDLHGRYEPRDYCVQYRESDFAFASRLMEEEGIYYFFEHQDGSHTMVVADTPGSHTTLPHSSELVYEELEGGTRDDDRIWAWEKTQEVRATRALLWDHSFEVPHKHVESESIILDSVEVGEETHKLRVEGTEGLELYDWPGGYAQRFDGISKGGADQPAELQKIFTDGKRTVELRMDEETTPAVVARGASNVKQLMAGHKFDLKRHFNADGEYVLLSVHHEGHFAADVRAEGKAPAGYENSFTCMPSGLKFRPARVTPRPAVRGCQTAVVVGPAGEEIFCDKYGRVKVQFHWDREGANDDDSSCWVRVGTFWAGKQWGAVHIPRIGHEVIVDFLEGDPDQPIIVGSVYNADMMPPYKLPDNKTQSGIKSRSTLKGTVNNFNEIRFEDKKGQEEVYIHAERDMTTVVERNEVRAVGQHRTTGVTGDEKTDVKGNRVTNIHGTETLNVIGGPRAVNVNGSDTLYVKGNHYANTTAEYHVHAPEFWAITENKVHLKAGGSEIYIFPDRIELLSGGSSLRVDAAGIHLSGARIDGTAVGLVEWTGALVKLNC